MTSNGLKPPSQLGLFKEMGDFAVVLSSQVVGKKVFFLLNTRPMDNNTLPG